MKLQQLIETLVENQQPYICITDTTPTSSLLPNGFKVDTDIRKFPEFTRIHHADNRPGTLLEINDNIFSISVDANTQCTQLVHLIVVSENISKRRINIEIGKNAQVRFILHEVATAAYQETLSIHVGENAHTELTIIDSNEKTNELSFLRESTVEKDATLNVAIASLSNGNTQSENFMNLVGKNATATSKLITVGSGEQVQLHRVQINNLAQYTNGDILNHGVMKEKSRGEFYGVGFIQNGQNGSNNEQESRMMIIDEQARADVHPILLIDEYDVIAGHAGSVGKVSEEALYYLMSRGMTKAEADRLITKGFLSPVLEHIEETTVREMLEELIERKI
ncbi:MAG: SufD family Fe-S cluster assembly protein [Culicoidibacterales bacterium]